MKYIVLIFIIASVVTFFVSKLVNYSTHIVDAEKKILQAEIYGDLLKSYSVKNAGVINSLLSSKNSPIRPENESFFDMVMKDVGDIIEEDPPESKIINLKDVLIESASEGTNGSK